MATMIDEDPDSLEAIEREQGVKRISALKRAIAGIMGVPAEVADSDLVSMIKVLRGNYGSAAEAAADMAYYKKRLRKLRRDLIDLGVQSDDPDEDLEEEERG